MFHRSCSSSIENSLFFLKWIQYKVQFSILVKYLFLVLKTVSLSPCIFLMFSQLNIEKKRRKDSFSLGPTHRFQPYHSVLKKKIKCHNKYICVYHWFILYPDFRPDFGSDNLISLSHSMAALCVNLFRIFQFCLEN